MRIRIGGSFGQPEVIQDVPSLDILAEDGTTVMFTLSLLKGSAGVECLSGGTFKQHGVVYESGRMSVTPVAANVVNINRTPYVP